MRRQVLIATGFTVVFMLMFVQCQVQPVLNKTVKKKRANESSRIRIQSANNQIDQFAVEQDQFYLDDFQNDDQKPDTINLGDDSAQVQRNTDFSFYQCQSKNNCQAGQECISGKCGVKQLDIKNCVKPCGKGFRCRDGQCVSTNKCANVTCKDGNLCQFGKCVPPKKTCKLDTDCTQDQKCRKGKCMNACKNRKCKGGSFCVHGNCITQPNKLCGNRGVCPKGTYCDKDKCVPIIQVCPRGSKFNATVCPAVRPNQASCPGKSYIQTPDPQYCGVKEDGQRISYPRECEACKDSSIVYYFDKPCHKVPFNCKEDQNCLGYYCSKKGCKQDNQCPYNWQTCSKGKCVDKCTMMKCHGCKFGQCQFQEPKGQCSVLKGVLCKKLNWTCIGSSCIDRCLKTPCPLNTKCQAGLCQKIK